MANFSTHRTTSKFGTLPVFMTTISTILGAVLFLRFGYAVGHQGFLTEKTNKESRDIFNKLYTGYNRLGNVLFVSANKKKEIN